MARIGCGVRPVVSDSGTTTEYAVHGWAGENWEETYAPYDELPLLTIGSGLGEEGAFFPTLREACAFLHGWQAGVAMAGVDDYAGAVTGQGCGNLPTFGEAL